ncbi:MAG: hypothetical protein R2710_02535 [Acidimicrobiales bacterium]
MKCSETGPRAGRSGAPDGLLRRPQGPPEVGALLAPLEHDKGTFVDRDEVDELRWCTAPDHGRPSHRYEYDRTVAGTGRRVLGDDLVMDGRTRRWATPVSPERWFDAERLERSRACSPTIG